MNVFEDTNNITLHSKNLTIHTDQITVTERIPNSSKDDKPLKIASTEFLIENDYFVIHTTETLKKDTEYVVYIPFEGVLSQSLTGYYKSSYYDLKSQKKM